MENLFNQKPSRADITYKPPVKDLKDAMLPSRAFTEDREVLVKILDNYEKES